MELLLVRAYCRDGKLFDLLRDLKRAGFTPEAVLRGVLGYGSEGVAEEDLEVLALDLPAVVLLLVPKERLEDLREALKRASLAVFERIRCEGESARQIALCGE